MLGRASVLSTLGLLCLLPSCNKGGPRELRDSEGRVFSAVCEGKAPCKIEQKSGPKRTAKPEQKLLLGSRLVGVCDVTPGAEPEGPFDCRPLSCQTDAECPPLHGMADGQCLNKRCADPAEEVSAADSIMLCLAGTGLGRETPAQIERYALALNCGSPCRVPAPCAQP